jgi:biotin carboxyl carrier protein
MITKREYYAFFDAQEHKVEIIEHENNIFEVTINDEKHLVDFAQIEESIYSIIIDNKSYAVDLNEKGDSFEILINGDYYNVEILDEIKKTLKEKKLIEAEGKQILEAPMPGNIAKIFLDEGNDVEKGQPLLILVAMKMEIEIKSPKKGVVSKIYVKPGEAVSTGTKLVFIDLCKFIPILYY